MTSARETEPAINWQEAVATLTRERTVAETSAGLLKKYGDAMAIVPGALAYGEAKAEYDGIIAGLTVALARKAAPASLPDLEARMQRAFAMRQAFCQSVEPLVHQPKAGEKGVVEEVVKGAVGPLIDALKAIWLRTRDDSALTRKTIQTQLEAATWSDFTTVVPSA